MSEQKIDEALKLLEQARRLLKCQSNPNIEKSRTFLRESIRCLKDRT